MAERLHNDQTLKNKSPKNIFLMLSFVFFLITLLFVVGMWAYSEIRSSERNSFLHNLSAKHLISNTPPIDKIDEAVQTAVQQGKINDIRILKQQNLAETIFSTFGKEGFPIEETWLMETSGDRLTFSTSDPELKYVLDYSFFVVKTQNIYLGTILLLAISTLLLMFGMIRRLKQQHNQM